jgi:hypothetical protein
MSAMRRWLPVAALLAAAALAGCGRNDDAQGVGPGPGPAQPPQAASAGDNAAQQRLDRISGQVSGAARVSDDGPLPGGELFDGSGRYDSALGGGSVVRASYSPGSSNSSYRGYTLSRPRSLSARGGVPPSPGGLPALAFPKADPSAGARGGGPVLEAFDTFQRKTYEAALPVLSRLAWGARRARGAEVPMHPTHVTVHHTDGHPRTKLTDSIEEVRGIQAFHQGPERNWADIGYHFVIDGAGRVFEGRHADVLGAHAGGANTDNIGIAMMGDYNRDQLSEDQKTALRRLITFLALRYRVDPKQKGFIQPHMHYSNTDCPGKNVLAFLDQLRREVDGETTTLASGGAPSGASSSFVPLAVLR